MNIIAKARVTFVLTGYGDLTLTDEVLAWNKAGTSFLAFGLANAATKDFISIPLKEIGKIRTYTYFPGGGLLIMSKAGKEYKFSFKHKKDFNVIYDYLKSHVEE